MRESLRHRLAQLQDILNIELNERESLTHRLAELRDIDLTHYVKTT